MLRRLARSPDSAFLLSLRSLSSSSAVMIIVASASSFRLRQTTRLQQLVQLYSSCGCASRIPADDARLTVVFLWHRSGLARVGPLLCCDCARLDFSVLSSITQLA